MPSRQLVLGVRVCGWAVSEGGLMDLPSGTDGGHGFVTNDDGPVRMTPDEVTAKMAVTCENADPDGPDNIRNHQQF